MDGDRTIVDRLSAAIALARRLGAEIHHENLGETPAGVCRVGERVRVYLDMSDGPGEQLRTVVRAIELLQAGKQPTKKAMLGAVVNSPVDATKDATPARDAA